MDALLGFIDGDFALNVIFGRIQQIGRGVQPVHRLQANGGLPRLAFFSSVRFALLDIFFQFKLPILIGHICTSFLAQIYRLEGRAPLVIIALVDAVPIYLTAAHLVGQCRLQQYLDLHILDGAALHLPA